MASTGIARIIAGAATLLTLVAISGCHTTGHPVTATQPAQTQPASQPARAQDVLAGSDAQRAIDALERDWPRGQRRPAAPPPHPVIDQPRPTRR